jgi:hypothetical protein
VMRGLSHYPLSPSSSPCSISPGTLISSFLNNRLIIFLD